MNKAQIRAQSSSQPKDEDFFVQACLWNRPEESAELALHKSWLCDTSPIPEEEPASVRGAVDTTKSPNESPKTHKLLEASCILVLPSLPR
ncbi:hypothetical protein ACTXT7_004115 [Hymenolepis weldensis]